MTLVRLCQIGEVQEGEPFAANPPGFPPLAVYQVKTEYYVTNNICTHSFSLLTDGFQEGSVIECLVHGGTFDIPSGEAMAFPCRIPLTTYSVVVEDGWISIAAPTQASDDDTTKIGSNAL